MKKIKALLYIFFFFILNKITTIYVFTEGPGGIFGSGIVSKDDVREGRIHIDNIPNILIHMIDLLLGISGTIAVIFIIIGAYKILFGSLTSEKTKGKDTIIMALFGFAIATLAWFIINFILSNFSNIS